jgi:hypothetical protein
MSGDILLFDNVAFHYSCCVQGLPDSIGVEPLLAPPHAARFIVIEGAFLLSGNATIPPLGESLRPSAHGDTPGHIASFLRRSFSIPEGPHLRA